MLIYVTGVPGSGKSSVCEELRARGYASVDADERIGAWIVRDTGEALREPPVFSARLREFYEEHMWRYQQVKAEELATSYADTVCFMGGCAAGEAEILHLFARTFFLSVGAAELTRRLMTRTNGPFAHAPQAVRMAQVDRVLPNQNAVEQAWLREGFELVNSARPLAAVAEDILARCDLPSRGN